MCGQFGICAPRPRKRKQTLTCVTLRHGFHSSVRRCGRHLIQWLWGTFWCLFHRPIGLSDTWLVASPNHHVTVHNGRHGQSHHHVCDLAALVDQRRKHQVRSMRRSVEFAWHSAAIMALNLKELGQLWTVLHPWPHTSVKSAVPQLNQAELRPRGAKPTSFPFSPTRQPVEISGPAHVIV